jgi:hypothetical protein
MDRVKKEAIRQIRKAIPEEDQMLWTFSLADAQTKLSWEHSREFEYKGEMYDVIRSETRGDSVSYWCYWDRKETKLKRELNVLVANMLGPGAQNRNQEKQIQEFFRTLFSPTTPPAPFHVISDPQGRCITPYHLPLSAFELTPPYPPPELS